MCASENSRVPAASRAVPPFFFAAASRKLLQMFSSGCVCVCVFIVARNTFGVESVIITIKDQNKICDKHARV